MESKELKKLEGTYKRDGREFIEYQLDYGEPMGRELSVNRCVKLTRKEVMKLAADKINKICEEFGVWTGADGTVDGEWAILRCKTTNQTICI